MGDERDPVLGIPGLRAATRPLARLVAAAVAIGDHGHRPGLVGLTGAVASGKTTTAEALAQLLSDEHGLETEILSTDGFLWPNGELERRGLTVRKGYPETYDYASLLAVVVRLERGERHVEAPVYDHLAYDVVAGRSTEVGGADVVLVEGLNVLQDPPTGQGSGGSARRGPSVADQLDLGVYVDAAEPDLRTWYRSRVARLRAEATGDGSSFYDGFAGLDDDAFGAVADQVWETVNLPNLVDHIEPSRDRADVVVVKAADHSIHQIEARSERARQLVASLAGDST